MVKYLFMIGSAMSDRLTLFHKAQRDLPVYVPRDQLYTERRTTYQDYYVRVVDLFLFNNNGELLLQKRAKHKKTMPGMYHTTVGGHIDPGECPEVTCLHESLEEMGSPVMFVPDEADAIETLERVRSYTDQFALLLSVVEIRKDIDAFQIPGTDDLLTAKDRTVMGMGIYNGPFINKDGSADGADRFSLEALTKARRECPDKFTGILHHYCDTYREDFKQFVETYARPSIE